MIEPARLGWMAAILDIQGLVIQKKNYSRATPQVVLAVDSANTTVVRELCALTGTDVEMKKQNKLRPEWRRRACTIHCPEAHVHLQDVNMPLTGRWTITGVGAAMVLHGLRPHLVTWDVKSWSLAYELCMDNAVFTGQGSGMTRSVITRLVDLGWELPPGWADVLITYEEPHNWTEDQIQDLINEARTRPLAIEA